MKIAFLAFSIFLFSAPAFSQEGGKSVWESQCFSCHNGNMAESKEELLKVYKDKALFVKDAREASENGSCSTSLDFEKAANELFTR